MRKFIGITLLILLLYGISQSPGPWADTFHALGNRAGEAASGVSTFLTELAS